MCTVLECLTVSFKWHHNAIFMLPITQKNDITKLPSNLRMTTSECMHWVTCGHLQSCDKDGGHIIRFAISENPMIHANSMALCFLEPQLLPIEFLHCRNMDFYFSALWPRPWLVMAQYSHKGHDTIQYDITQNIVIRYDMIRSESASPYVRTACCHLQTTAIYGCTYSSKQVTAHNTGAPSFCLSTLSPLQVLGYWPSGEATVGGQLWRLSTAAIVWRPHGTAVWQPHGRQAVARLKYLVIAQSLNIWAVRLPSQSTHGPTREAG